MEDEENILNSQLKTLVPKKKKKNTVKEIYKILYIVWSSGLSFIGEVSSTSEIKIILSYLLGFHLLEYFFPKKQKNSDFCVRFQ
jgi:hypothetical protein